MTFLAVYLNYGIPANFLMLSFEMPQYQIRGSDLHLIDFKFVTYVNHGQQGKVALAGNGNTSFKIDRLKQSCG